MKLRKLRKVRHALVMQGLRYVAYYGYSGKVYFLKQGK